ncbi:MAG: hypothetical protein ACXVXY_00110 [Mycobacteriaceae bacterium]
MNIADGYHERGEEVDVPGDVASNLARLDRAVIVRGERPATPERATRTEKATRRRREETR